MTSFVVMLVTIGINLAVIVYEGRAAERLASEVLLADAMQTRSDVWTSLAVMGALAGARLGFPILDPLAAILVAGFIAYSGYQVANATTGILSDRIVIADVDIERVVLDVNGVLGCHHIRTRGFDRPRVPGPSRLVPSGHATHRCARSVARRQGPADGALPADRGRDHPHRAAAVLENASSVAADVAHVGSGTQRADWRQRPRAAPSTRASLERSRTMPDTARRRVVPSRNPAAILVPAPSTVPT